jgi:hypothetical protein
MSKNPQSSEIARIAFDKAHEVAIRDYKRFWMYFFKEYGFVVQETNEDWWATFEMAYKTQVFVCEVRPAHYTGIKISEKNNGYVEKKVMTSNGAISWMKKNNVGHPPTKRLWRN